MSSVAVGEAVESPFKSYVAEIPKFLWLNGKPMTLKSFFPMEPMFKVPQPDVVTVASGRQVSKTTVIAAKQVLTAVAQTNRKFLTVTPLYEQVRNISSNYVARFIYESPHKDRWIGRHTLQNVLQRSFLNGSDLFFSFAGLSADRIRGRSISAWVNYDESVRVNTMIRTPSGCRPVENFRPGDPVLSFDEEGHIYEDTVVACQDHGVRECFLIELSDGSSVEATSESWIATTQGWKRLETIISDFCSSTASSGDSPGGWEYVHRRKEPSVLQQSQLQTTRLQLPKVPGLIRVRTNSSREKEELRLREMVESLGHRYKAGASSYSLLVLPQKEETSKPAMVGSVDLGRNSLVVSGRRLFEQSISRFQHSRVLEERSFPSGSMVTGERNICLLLSNQTATEVLLDHSRDRRVYQGLVRPYSDLRFPGDEIQAGFAQDNNLSYLQLVSPGVCSSEQANVQDPFTAWKADHSLLSKGRMPEGQKEAWSSFGQETVTTRSGVTEGSHSNQTEKMVSGQHDQSQTVQTDQPVQTTGSETSKTMGLPRMRFDRATGGQGYPSEVLPLLPSHSVGKNQTRKLKEVAVVGVRWTGKHQVFDLEIKNHNTFFAGNIAVHNCQDIDYSLVSTINETMSAADWGGVVVTGTHKTESTTLWHYWSKSSQAHWVVPCSACGKKNICSIVEGMLKMIGGYREDITIDNPGTICQRCSRPVRPHEGWWEHKYPKKQFTRPGYHIPQLIMPMHYGSKRKWGLLCAKMKGDHGFTGARFYNEVLGEAHDRSNALISATDLEAVSKDLGWGKHDKERALAAAKNYESLVMSVDWSGGGSLADPEQGLSMTAFAIMGMAGDGTIDVIYGGKLISSVEHIGEARFLLKLFNEFDCDFLAHDYTGAGSVRETILNHSGIAAERLWPVRFCMATKGPTVRVVHGSAMHPRVVWQVDKPRSIQMACGAIKIKKIRFFDYDYRGEDNPGIIHDFLAFVEHKIQTIRAGETYTIRRNPNKSDDFGIAVTMGAVALWHINQAWPNFGFDPYASIDDSLARDAEEYDRIAASLKLATDFEDEDSGP